MSVIGFVKVLVGLSLHLELSVLLSSNVGIFCKVVVLCSLHLELSVLIEFKCWHIL